MRKFLISLLTCGIFFVAKAQEEEIVNYTTEFKIGNIYNFDGKSIKFVAVISDSRCPSDVTCIWAGEAKIKIKIFQNNRFLGEKIIYLGGSSSLKFLGNDQFTISGLALLPYPKVTRKIAPKDYKLTLKMEKRLIP